MANTLTDLAPDLYAALDVVSRELVGMIPSVTVDARVNQAAVGQIVRSHVVPAANALIDNTPAMAFPHKQNFIKQQKKFCILYNLY